MEIVKTQDQLIVNLSLKAEIVVEINLMLHSVSINKYEKLTILNEIKETYYY